MQHVETTTPKTLIVVPTYNEKDNIPNLLRILMGFPEQIHVLVVDDGSPDGTGNLVEEWTRNTPDRKSVV